MQWPICISKWKNIQCICSLTCVGFFLLPHSQKNKGNLSKSGKCTCWFWRKCDVLNTWHRILHSEKNVACSATDAFTINTQWQARIATFAKGLSCFLSFSNLYDFFLDLHICYYKSIILLLEIWSVSILMVSCYPQQVRLIPSTCVKLHGQKSFYYSTANNYGRH